MDPRPPPSHPTPRWAAWTLGVINRWQSVLVRFQLDRIFYTSTGDTLTAGQVE